MAYEQSNPIENNRLTPSREFLVEKLQASEARIQELEVQVQSLEAELYTLRSPASPRHPVPRSTSPHEAPTITFHIEKPQDLQTEPNVEGKQSSELRRFLKQLPKTDEEWCDRRREVQLSNPEEVTRTFWGFITRTQSQAKTSEIQADPWSLTGERILRDYRQFVGCLQQESVRTVQVSNFAVLLFVCLCRVARMYGVCLETVDDLMDGILPRTKKPEKKKSNYLRKLRSNVLWPVHQAELLRNKYAHRADELFLLYGPSIRTYGRLSEDKSAKDFEHLAVLPLTPAGETNGDIPFSVPLMVKLISGPWFSLELINRALETSLSQEQLDAALSSIWARTQCLTVIQCPPAKRRKFDDEARTEDGHGLIEFKNILYPPMVCVQHGREAFSQRGSSASVADGTGSLPYGPGTCSPENEPAMDSDRCNSELADGVRPGNLTVETHGQELWALRLSTSFCSPERIPGNVPELLGFQSQTEVLTLPWHDSPTDLVNGVLRPTNGPSPFTEVMMLLDEPTGREINRDLQHDGREDEAGEESLFGGCIAGTDQLFEHEPSDFSF